MLGRFIKYIKEGSEDDIVELKAFSPPLRDKNRMDEIIKETLAISNTGKQGYVLFGVCDEDNRRKGGEHVPGVDDKYSDDQIEREIIDQLNNYTESPVRIKYSSYSHDENKEIGVLTILRSDRRPHMVAKSRGGLNRGMYYIRRGTRIEILTPDEIMQIKDEPPQKYITLLNFTHPFDEPQIKQLEDKLGCFIEHVWPNTKAHFNLNMPLEPQISSMVDALGFTPEEWDVAGRFIVSLPGLSEPSAVLLAELHGRMGHFPTIVRRRKDDQDESGKYLFAEVINLSNIRDKARHRGSVNFGMTNSNDVQ